MNRSLSPQKSLRGLLAVGAAGLAALSVSAPVTATGGTSVVAAPAASTQVSATARHVNLKLLPKAGASGHRQLPSLRPGRQGAAATTTRTATRASAPKTASTGSTGFEGDSYTQQNNVYTSGDQGVVPPDNGTATNNQYVVEFLNDSGWVYLRNNGAAGPIFSVDLNTMFIDPADESGCNAKPQPKSPCYSFSDPRVVWDAQSGRWFASGLAFDLTYASKEYVAVSDTWDATGGWIVNTVWASTAYLGDQPRLGVTSDKVVDFWDDYDSPTLHFQREDGKSVSKAALEAGAALDGTNSNESQFINTHQLAVVPAWDSTTSDTWAMWNDTDPSFTLGSACGGSGGFAADGNVHVIHLTGTAASPTLTESAFSPTAGITGGGCGMTAPQPGPGMIGSGPAINADDDRTETTAFDGTHLVTTANTTCGSSQICVRVFRVTVSGGTPSYVGDANITAPSKSTYYGAPALDGAGNLTVAFSESDSSTTWPSSAISGAAAASPLSFSAPAIIHAGQAMYNETGFVQECTAGLYSCRWGDYQGAQPDPCDPTFVWTSSEFADNNTTSAANWATWIAPVTFGAGMVPANCGGAPAVTGLTPSCGSAGNSITINGTGFTAASAVYFGNLHATSSYVSSTQLTATAPTPPSTPRTVDVSVVNAAGASAITAADKYSYVGTAAPTVSGVAPNTQPADGTTAGSVTVTGTNFEYPLTIHFGTVGSQVVNSSGPNATCTSVTVTAPTSSTPQAVDVTAQDSNGTSATNGNDKFYYIDGGYTLDAFGATHQFGNIQPPPARTDNPSFSFKIARATALRVDHGSGYILDGYGGIHPFGGAPAVTGYPYFPNFDIARDIALDPCDATRTSGYVLDGWGGVHPFGGAATATGYPYWPGWDIARRIVMNSCGHGGYVLDGYGGMHPFNGAAAATGYPYFPGLDIARGIALTGDGVGYIVDGYGGVHPFGGAATATGYPYWPGWDIARGIAKVPGLGIYVLDGYGGIHPINGAPAVTPTGYSSGHDIYRDID